jgi:Tol biopolymer transport system component
VAAATGCALLALLFGCGDTSSPSANGAGSQPHRVTARAHSPDLSKGTTSPATQAPAGARPLRGSIVFSNFPLDGSAKQLHLEHADGSHLRQVLHSARDDVQPTISPDGRHIVFTRQRNHGNLPDQIFEVRANGRGLHQIVPDGCPTATCGDAVEGHAYSPDGHRLVFTRAVFTDGPTSPPAFVELWTCDLDGTHAQRLTHEDGRAQDDDASWSPDGRRVVFLHWVYGPPDHFRIATIGADGHDQRLVTPLGLDSADPSYSPQGDLISFQSPPDPGAELQTLYTIRTDGTHLTELSASQGTAANHPSWSPNGDQLLFCYIPRGQAHGADLAVIKRDGTNMRVLAQTPLNENNSYWGANAPG